MKFSNMFNFKNIITAAAVFTATSNADITMDLGKLTYNSDTKASSYSSTDSLLDITSSIFFNQCDAQDRCTASFSFIKRLGSERPYNNEIDFKYTGSGWSLYNPILDRTASEDKGFTVAVNGWDRYLDYYGIRYIPNNPLNLTMSASNINYNDLNGIVEVTFSLEYDKPVDFSCLDTYCTEKGNLANFEIVLIMNEVEEEDFYYTALDVDRLGSSIYIENQAWVYQSDDFFSASDNGTISNAFCIQDACQMTVTNTVELLDGFVPANESGVAYYGSINSFLPATSDAYIVSYHTRSVLGIGGITPVPGNIYSAAIADTDFSFDAATNTLTYSISFEYEKPPISCTRGGCFSRGGFNYNIIVDLVKENENCHDIVSVNEDGKLVFTLATATSDNMFVGGYNNGVWFFNYLAGRCESTSEGQVCTSAVDYNGGDVISRFEGQAVPGYYQPGPSTNDFYPAFNAANCE